MKYTHGYAGYCKCGAVRAGCVDGGIEDDDTALDVGRMVLRGLVVERQPLLFSLAHVIASSRSRPMQAGKSYEANT